MLVRAMSEEGRGGSQLVNRTAARRTARAMLLAAKEKAANYSTDGSDEHLVLRREASLTLVEPPVLKDGSLGSDISHKHSDNTEVKFKRIVIAKTAVINMMKRTII